MKRDIEEYVRQCKSWQTNKLLRPKTKVPVDITTTASKLFEKTVLDIVGPLTYCISPPQSNGSLERSHITLVQYLRHYVLENQRNWDSFIPFVCYCYITTKHTTTGYTPFELLYGFKPTLRTSLTQTPELSYAYDDYVAELKGVIQSSHEIA
ncbi:hypothetical protein PR048_026851, partial [Dryococelus australis]